MKHFGAVSFQAEDEICAMGAAIGVFTGRRVVKWQHTHPGNRLDRWLLGVSVSTIPNGQRIVRPIILPMR